MEKTEKAKQALRVVVHAAEIHSEHLTESVRNSSRYDTDSFKAARREYIRKLDKAIVEVSKLKLDEELRLKERVSDLSLEDSLDLLEAVQEHIRNRPRTKFSEFK